MTQTTASERVAPWDEWAATAPGAGYTLSIVFVYQNSQTRKWAKEVYERVAKIAGPETARATWWRISDLSEPGVLAGAVSTAMRADVIVVAVKTGEGLPLPFYVWVNAWLPHRGLQTGALVALLGEGADQGLHRARVREYLQMVARQSKLDFLPEERELPDDGEDWPTAIQVNHRKLPHRSVADRR
jgi:hypothetical protein